MGDTYPIVAQFLGGGMTEIDDPPANEGATIVHPNGQLAAIVEASVTSTIEGSGNVVKRAAENWFMSKTSPSAVAFIWKASPYQEAMPVSS